MVQWDEPRLEMVGMSSEGKRWTDDEGNEGVFREGRLSIFGKPSMTADDGTVAVGIEAPWIASEVERLREEEPERLLRIEREFRDRYLEGDNPHLYPRMMAAHAARMEVRLEQEKRKVERLREALILIEAWMGWDRPDSWKVREGKRIARAALHPDEKEDPQ